MKFDVTDLNLKDVLRALVANAKPKGYGERIYEACIERGENVDSVSEREMKEFFSEFNGIIEGSCRVVDYYKGMPIKLDLTKNDDGQVIANSIGYDVSHGEFEFLKALLPFFLLEEIKIIDKAYNAMIEPADSTGDKEQARLLKTFVEDASRQPYRFGYYWELNPEHPSYAAFKL